MKMLHSNVWYANEERAKSARKVLFYSDKGSLSSTENEIHFQGSEQTQKIANVSRIYMKHPTLNWITYILGGVACLMIDLILGSEISDLKNTNWALTKFYIFLAPICIILFWLPLRWVVIEYNSGSAPRKAYFSSGKRNGWSALFGANNKLKGEIEDSVRAFQKTRG